MCRLRLGTAGAGWRCCEGVGSARPARRGHIHAVRQVLLEPLIGGADVGETLRGPDLHLVNLLEGQDRFNEVVEGAARHHVDVMDARVGRGMHPAARLILPDH